MRIKYGVIMLILVIYFSTNVLSGSVCGEVKNEGVLSPSWMKTIIYYKSSPNNTILCTISSLGNRYCCDPEDIKGTGWTIGKTMVSKIVDTENGYYASGVELNTSGQGYDVFPELFLRKVINLEGYPFLVYSNISTLMFNISTIAPFNSIYLNISNNSQIIPICSNCTNYTISISNISQGKYNLIFYASNSEIQFKKEKQITMVDNLEVNREFICKECKGDTIPKDTLVLVKIQINSSFPVGGEYIELVPIDFEVNGGKMEPYSITHNQIKWNITDALNLNLNYTIKTPQTFLTRKYEIKSSFEGIAFPNYEVYIKGALHSKRLSIKKRYSDKSLIKLKEEIFANLNPKNPLLMTLNNSIIQDLVIFPDNSAPLVNFELLALPKNGREGAESFYLKSSDNNLSISQIRVSYKVLKSYFPDSQNITAVVGHSPIPQIIFLAPSSGDREAYYYNYLLNNSPSFTLSIPENE